MANGRWQMVKRALPFAIFLLPLALSLALAGDEAGLTQQLTLLNQIPEMQLNEKLDPCFSIIRAIYTKDGPDFLTLRSLLGRAEVRSHLNPSSRCVLANVLSQRWDTFTLSGNLYLSALQSKNPDLRDKARQKLVWFIQPAHLPALIELLRVPGPNVLARDVLEEVTGEHMDPTVQAWQGWWLKRGLQCDIVGHLINDTRTRLKQYAVHPFDQERFWYAPEGIVDVQMRLDRRPQEQKSAL